MWIRAESNAFHRQPSRDVRQDVRSHAASPGADQWAQGRSKVRRYLSAQSGDISILLAVPKIRPRPEPRPSPLQEARTNPNSNPIPNYHNSNPYHTNPNHNPNLNLNMETLIKKVTSE